MEESSPQFAPPPLPFWLDGKFHHVDPNSIPVDRINMALTSFILLFFGFFALIFVGMSPELARSTRLLSLSGWLALWPLLGIYSWVWPSISYRHLFYCLREDCMIIRSGVFWKTETLVPKSRIQHTDISQGPLQRSYKISDLVIHTAGTRYAVVTLTGLSEDIAPRLRNHLLDRTGDDSTL
ncbi:MAG: PH domain-containing protein [Opitutales bacterium]